MPSRVVLVTGLPRSGTTLTAELLNAIPDTIALDEPMDRAAFTVPRVRLPRVPRAALRRVGLGSVVGPMTDAKGVAANIERFLAAQRTNILEGGRAISKNVDGRVVGAKVADDRRPDGRRRTLASRGEISIDKPLSANFLLAAKHNSAFAAVLPALVRRFDVYAVVRNPLAILSSWQTVPFAVGRGHATLAELFDPTLADALASIDDVLDRQLHLLGWFFRRFDDLPADRIIRYEDLVASDGAVLARVAGATPAVPQPLASRNTTKVYDAATSARLGARLLETDGPWWRLYEPSAVAELLPA